MPQDAFTLRLSAKELNAALRGGKISKIVQPGREETVLYIYTQKTTLKLILNVNASDCGIYFTEHEVEAPLVAPNFCMLLRKHLQNAEILSVSLVGFERIVKFELACRSDFNDCKRELYAEIMGKYSNLILTENGVILGALKTTSADLTVKRMILTGAKYTLPAAQEKADPSDKTALAQALRAVTGDLGGAIFARVAGLAPHTAEQIAKSYTGGDLAEHVYGSATTFRPASANGIFTHAKARGSPLIPSRTHRRIFTIPDARRRDLKTNANGCSRLALRRSKNMKNGSRRRSKNANSAKTRNFCA